MRVCLTQGPAQGLLIVSEPHGWAKEGRALLRPTHISGRLRSLGGGVSQRRLREQAFFERLGEWGGAGPEGLGRGGWVPIQRVLSAKSGLHLACLPPPSPSSWKRGPGLGPNPGSAAQGPPPPCCSGASPCHMQGYRAVHPLTLVCRMQAPEPQTEVSF